MVIKQESLLMEWNYKEETQIQKKKKKKTPSNWTSWITKGKKISIPSSSSFLLKACIYIRYNHIFPKIKWAEKS